MQDWDTRIVELKKNIDEARKRYVLPFLNSSDLENQVPDETNLEKQASDNVKPKTIEETNSKIDELTPKEVTESLDKVITDNGLTKKPAEEEAKSDASPETSAEEASTEKNIGRKRKKKEVKPDLVAIELSELEKVNENDLTEEQEDRLMELRRIRTQRAMHSEVDENFQNEMKQADEEIKTLKSQLKIKDKLPKGYIE